MTAIEIHDRAKYYDSMDVHGNKLETAKDSLVMLLNFNFVKFVKREEKCGKFLVKIHTASGIKSFPEEKFKIIYK